MSWGEAVLRAPGLGQCRLHCIQLFAAHLQLDPKQRRVCAIAGFLKLQVGLLLPLLLRLLAPGLPAQLRSPVLSQLTCHGL